MRFCTWVYTVCIFLFVPVAVHAELERTVSAWDARTPDRGNVLANIWSTYGDYHYKTIDAAGETFDYQILLSYGITEWWSIGVIAAWSRWEENYYGIQFSEKGIGDTQAVSTFRLLDESHTGFDLALRVSLNMPTGDNDKFIGSDHWEPMLEVVTAKAWGPMLTVVNLGLKHIIDPDFDEEAFLLQGNLECVFSLNQYFSASVLLSGWTSRWQSSLDDGYLQVGLGLRTTPQENFFISGTVYRLLDNNTYDDAWYFTLNTGIEF